MIYEVNTINLKPGAWSQYESGFNNRHPIWKERKRLFGIWHTDIGPLNQVVLVWVHQDFNQRQATRESGFEEIPVGRQALRVTMLTIDEEYEGQFGGYGKGEGQLMRPTSIAVDSH